MFIATFWSGLWHGRYDKTAHFLLSALLTFVFSFFFSWTTIIVLLAILSVLKELIDWRWRRQKFDLLGILTNFAGLAVILLILNVTGYGR